ncbi:MAG: SDR family NAD(P)-dependent oxidoreductase [Crocinitomicaceae bacterium]|nr:SDR family NAD(P)-dependent oxidoreductase [Crocinitomicaceae bacterium]MBK8926613.1 SDR family NAD(P)-dependent oxidoreductase [Crocinitomicaceae bacterium]
MEKTETILVTGGAGFIGSNLCNHLISEGYRVRCLDNLLTGKRENIKHLLDHPFFSFIEGDIRDFSICKTVMKDVDKVLHQAALGSVPRSIENPIPTNEINCQGFLNVITAAKEEGVKRFIYASSSSVYGDSSASPKSEENLGKPLSPYAVSKLTNELYGRIFHTLYGTETIGLRYFNVFGLNQDPNGQYAAAIPKFIHLLKEGKSPVVFGDGNQTRDFTYVKNVVNANMLALHTENKSCYGKMYNVACGYSQTVNQVIAQIKNVLTSCGYDFSAVQTEYRDERKGDILNSLASIDSIRHDLNYKPIYTFDQGIAEYIRQTC